MWSFFGSEKPQFTEDKTKFLDFFPNTCAKCRTQSDALFECLSSKSAEHLKSS
eukprot:CAMPEP_0202975268 /NCGR_PEP_ID=MMETSP1396-20130829/67624_1 /ASSEMBLY_ACC=CAM_ASM_000872 /TAXON_ID= /ORGANISM="Pseudokeronopsis sp., Strain Brazil" /LENGTH=52 /DNA_ID=CAMNT_0049710559 /DNA_START=16 /DNA_END=170 /DNA_ORIENTATION=+